MEFSSGGVEKVQLKNRERKKNLIPIIQQFLPHEIIIEILSWLPVESLLRFKCVSKQWYSLIQDRRFIMKHLIQYNPVTYERHPNKYEVDGKNFKYMDSSCGLVLEMNSDSMKYRIRNPSTRQILDLPAPQNSSYSMRLFNVPNTTTFKVVSVFGNEYCEVLTVGTDEQWRPLTLPSVSKLGNVIYICKLQVELFIIHCIWSIGDETKLCIRVDSLDMKSECLSTHTMPQGFVLDLTKVFVMSWHGRLAFADIVEENLNVMLLESWEEQKWSQRKIMVPLTFLKEDQGMKENLVPCLAQSNKLWFQNNEKVFSCNIESGKLTDVHPSHQDTYTIRPSLITFEGMQPEKNQPEMNL